MKKADLALLVAAPAKGAKPAPAPKGMPKASDDTEERAYFEKAFPDMPPEGISALISGVRACVQKELDKGY